MLTREILNEHRRRCTEPRTDGNEYQPTRELVLKLLDALDDAHRTIANNTGPKCPCFPADNTQH